MTSFAKHIAALAAALIATTALAEQPSDNKAATPDPKVTAGKKPKKGQSAKSADEPTPPPKKIDVPVIQGHPSKGLVIPYYDSTGKHEMQFHIDVATRVDENHVHMTNLEIETFDEESKPEMQIDLPTAVLDTDTSVVTSEKHVTISRDDFKLTGEAMIFNTRTKQGGLGGNVRMVIYNLDEQTSGGDKPDASKGADKKPNSPTAPDTFKTPHPKNTGGTPPPPDKIEKFLTPGSK